MGLPHYTIESLSVFFFLDFTLSNFFSSLPVKEEHISELSIHSCRNSLLNQSRHYFLICKTASGRRIRLDYSEDLGVSQSNFYYPGLFEKTHRSSQAVPLTTTTHALKVFQKYSKLKDYDPNLHNCQTVTLNTFEELSGDSASVLNNRLEDVLNQWEDLKKLAKVGKVGKIDKFGEIEEFWNLEFGEKAKKKFMNDVISALAAGKTKQELLDGIEESFKEKDEMKLKSCLKNNDFKVKYDVEFMKGFNSPSDMLYKHFVQSIKKPAKSWEVFLTNT